MAERMWMLKTAYLAPAYGIASTRKALMEKIPVMPRGAKCVRVTVVEDPDWRHYQLRVRPRP